jgi:hypothetical protein
MSWASAVRIFHSRGAQENGSNRTTGLYREGKIVDPLFTQQPWALTTTADLTGSQVSLFIDSRLLCTITSCVR